MNIQEMTKEEIEVTMLEHAGKINEMLAVDPLTVTFVSTDTLQTELDEMFERYKELTK